MDLTLIEVYRSLLLPLSLDSADTVQYCNSSTYLVMYVWCELAASAVEKILNRFEAGKGVRSRMELNCCVIQESFKRPIASLLALSPCLTNIIVLLGHYFGIKTVRQE